MNQYQITQLRFILAQIEGLRHHLEQLGVTLIFAQRQQSNENRLELRRQKRPYLSLGGEFGDEVEHNCNVGEGWRCECKGECLVEEVDLRGVFGNGFAKLIDFSVHNDIRFNEKVFVSAAVCSTSSPPISPSAACCTRSAPPSPPSARCPRGTAVGTVPERGRQGSV